ncbi:MAG: MerR family transcriptional regulator [Microbacterium sp.]|uniref:MerR family transcriptional regulator n=1 Tax=Microbacterium sp. TaxID=51671 RepID=UPI003F9B65B3
MVKIGELAGRTGVSVRSLRYYEERGLLSAVRTAGGRRAYEADAVDRVILIQYFFAAGLNSATIATMLPCATSRTTTAEMLDALRARREHIDRRARELAASRDLVDDLITQAGKLLAG